MIVCLDADGVIYLVEQNPIWGPRVTQRLADLRAAGEEIAATDLARTECLARPFLMGNATVVADFQAFFNHPTIRMLPLTAASANGRPAPGPLPISGSKCPTACTWLPPSHTGVVGS